jgi:hypothetical protein
MVPPALRLFVDWVHIREAERRGRSVTPFGLALAEQSRFAAGSVAPEGITLVDALTGAEARYRPNADLSDYLRRFARGEAVAPAVFTLTLEVGA